MTMERRQFLKLSSAVGAAALTESALSQSPSSQPARQTSYDVRGLGVKGDGRTIDSSAINAAIEAVAAAGGGTLEFPAGVYLCFTIRLKSNVDLYLGRGCIIQAADSPRTGEVSGYGGGSYDTAEPNSWEPYQDYGHDHWRNSLFYAEDQMNFSILGPGLIFGKGLSNGSGHGRGGYDGFIAEQRGVGNKVFGLKNCHNVLLRDFQVLKGGHFVLLATGVDNMVIDNLMIDTDRDGLDIDCCRNVRVSNCTINSPWDDAICPKSSYALGYPRPSENITIADNYVTGGFELGSVLDGSWKRLPDNTTILREGRIKFGTESNGGFKNVTITGNVIESCKGIALESADGAYLEDFSITGNTMRNVTDCPIFLGLNRRNRNPKETVRPGTLRRILIANLVCHDSDASTSSMLSGTPGNLIEDVKFTNCYFGHKGLPKQMRVGYGDSFKPMPDWKTIETPEREDGGPDPLRYGPTPCHGFFIRHLKNLEMSHVEITASNPDPRPAFWLLDVHRADFFAVTASAQKNFRLRNVSDIRVAWSRAASDTTLSQADDQTI